MDRKYYNVISIIIVFIITLFTFVYVTFNTDSISVKSKYLNKIVSSLISTKDQSSSASNGASILATLFSNSQNRFDEDDIRKLINTPDKFQSYLHTLTIQQLLDLAHIFQGKNDLNVLRYGIGIEIISRCRGGESVKPIIMLAQDINETVILRQFAFELLDATIRKVEHGTQDIILYLCKTTTFKENNVPFEVRRSCLICYNTTLLTIQSEGGLDTQKLNEHCELFNTLYINETEPDEIRALAIDGVGRLHYTDAKRSLTELLTSNDDHVNPQVSRAASLALARLGALDTVPIIGKVLGKTEDSRVYDSAVISLGRLGGEKALHILVDKADRFDTGSSGVAIRYQKKIIFEILSDKESTNLNDAIKATQYFYSPEDVQMSRDMLMDLLPEVDSAKQKDLILASIYTIGTKKDCHKAIKLVPRKDEYSKTWDMLYRKATGIVIQGHIIDSPLN